MGTKTLVLLVVSLCFSYVWLYNPPSLQYGWKQSYQLSGGSLCVLTNWEKGFFPVSFFQIAEVSHQR
jgi:hypothetical protein